VEVVFPQDYVSELGIPIITADSCNTLCEVNGNQVTFYFPTTTIQPNVE